MKAFTLLEQFFLRLRYPVSSPEDIAEALGIEASSILNFYEFISYLSSSSCQPMKLFKYMHRDEAEQSFRTALRKEHFGRNSLFSYYFNEGWVEFLLDFDDLSRLRRIYFLHKGIVQDRGIEIPLRVSA